MANITELFKNATEESKREYLATLPRHQQLLVKMCVESGVDLYESEYVPEGTVFGVATVELEELK